MTLNDLERRNSPYCAFFSPNSTDFQADYITVVEDRPIMSVKYCLPVRTLQRGLSAIAEQTQTHFQRQKFTVVSTSNTLSVGLHSTACRSRSLCFPHINSLNPCIIVLSSNCLTL